MSLKKSTKRRRRHKPSTPAGVAKRLAEKALAVAKSNAQAIETSVKDYSVAHQNVDFTSTGGPVSWAELTGHSHLAPDANILGSTLQLMSMQIRLLIQNREGQQHRVRVVIFQLPDEIVRDQVLNIAEDPLLGDHLVALHGGRAYDVAPYKRYDDDITTATTTLRYKILYDKVLDFGGSIDDRDHRVVKLDLKFNKKSAFYRVDKGTVNSHAKGSVILALYGDDLVTASGTRYMDWHLATRIRWRDA